MTLYTFNPPAEVDARQFIADVNGLEIADWIELKAGDDEEPRINLFYSQLGVELGGRALIVDTTDYVFFVDGKICKLSAPLFEYFFPAPSPV